MSVREHFFVGPYAEWLVPQGEMRSPPWDPEQEVLWRQEVTGDLPVVEESGRKLERHRYMPRQERPGRPRADMHSSGEGSGAEDQDLTDASPRAEIEWLAAAFGPELKALADYYGGPPTLRWGLTSWLT